MAKPSRPAPFYPEIPRRKLDFEFDPEEVPRDFYAGDPVKSLVMAALSVARTSSTNRA